jgi:hypothetical protein
MSEENVPKQVLARVIALGQLLATAQKSDKKPGMNGPNKPGIKRPPQSTTLPTSLQ